MDTNSSQSDSQARYGLLGGLKRWRSQPGSLPDVEFHPPRRKIALGLFHFNVQYVAGDIASYHRYCTHAVIPFINAVSRNKKYRVSFEMAGSGLEFLSLNYPAATDLLRELIDKNQIELISSTYAPTLWVAFPGQDLVKSVEINRACLDMLGLEAADIFFAQEAFFGPGLKVISPFFRAAICKDDYLSFFCKSEVLHSRYRLGNFQVVVCCNHLLNELRQRVIGPEGEGGPQPLPAFYLSSLLEAEETLTPSSPSLISGSFQDVDWYWYHAGSGHHFTTWAEPSEWETFFSDPDWTALNTGIIDDLVSEGYQCATITEFLDLTSGQDVEDLPPVIEGSWNPVHAEGVFTWMGKQVNEWENDSGNLALAWRSRDEVQKCAAIVENVQEGGLKTKLGAELNEIWKEQLFAESSDSLGWSPLPNESTFTKYHAAKTSELCSQFIARLGGDNLCECTFATQSPWAGVRFARVEQPLAGARLVGSAGTVQWLKVEDNIHLCDVHFRTAGDECGVEFMREGEYLQYCPSGMEFQPLQVELAALRPSTLYFPLTNGLISLMRNLYLIRVNRFGQVAARVVQSSHWITFSVRGSPKNSEYKWRFVLVKGDIQDGVELANRLNGIRRQCAE